MQLGRVLESFPWYLRTVFPEVFDSLTAKPLGLAAWGSGHGTEQDQFRQGDLDLRYLL